MSLHIEPLTSEPSEHIPIYDDMIMEEPNQDIKKQAKTKLVQLIDSAEIKLCTLMVQLNQESMDNPDSPVLESIQREMDVTNALLDRLQQYQRCNMFQDPKVSPDGISISFRDIPKFQIMGNNQARPISIQHEKFGCQCLSTMIMMHACREGGVKENANLAMRFMSSLTPELSSNIKLAWFAQYLEMPQTIEQENTFARNISSTIRMLLPTVTCFKNTSTQRKPVDIATSLGNTTTPAKSISKPKQGP
ncbi:hypothetical protein F4703DRAFT_1794657 [Phycomyces blakesleeanus]